MLGFKVALENQIETILKDYVGQGGQQSNPTSYIKMWDRKLAEFDPAKDVPLVAIMARQTNQRPRPSGEIGTARELWDWQVDIYYFDVESVDFNAGYARQDDISQRMINALENETRLRGLSVKINPASPSGAYLQYVYNNDWTSVIWSNSGQEGYWAFAVEFHLLVNTARN